MSLTVYTFYPNKGIFLRAVFDTIHYESITDSDKIAAQPYFFSKIISDKVNSTINIEYLGIAWTKNVLINYLGTIAKSGTKSFMEAMAAGGDISMIGHFGLDATGTTPSLFICKSSFPTTSTTTTTTTTTLLTSFCTPNSICTTSTPGTTSEALYILVYICIPAIGLVHLADRLRAVRCLCCCCCCCRLLLLLLPPSPSPLPPPPPLALP